MTPLLPILAILAAAAQAEPAPDPPAQGWRFTPSGRACWARILFPGGAALSVGYHVGHGSTIFRLWDPAWRSVRGGRQYRVTLRFSADSHFSTPNAVGARTEGPTRSGIAIHAAGRELIDRFAAGGGTMDVLLGDRRLGLYAVPDPSGAMARLRSCADQARAVPAPPINIASFFSHADYPRIALRNRQQGTVGFRMTIAANGRISDCTITSSSGWTSLDEATCRIIRRRVRYEPLRDAEGNPFTAEDDGTVTWTLPRRRR